MQTTQIILICISSGLGIALYFILKMKTVWEIKIQSDHPIVIYAENLSSEPKPVELYGSFQNRAAFNSGNLEEIRLLSGISGCSYPEILAVSECKPFEVTEIRLSGKVRTLLFLKTIVDYKEGNGNSSWFPIAVRPFIKALMATEELDHIADIKIKVKPFMVNGGTSICFDLLEKSKVEFIIYYKNTYQTKMSVYENILCRIFPRLKRKYTNPFHNEIYN